MNYSYSTKQQRTVDVTAQLFSSRFEPEPPEDVTCETCKYSTPYTVDGGTCGKFKAWFCLFEPMEESYNNVEQIEPTDKPCEAYAVL